MLYKFIALSFLTIAFTGSFAQPISSSPKALTVQRATLPNGLRVIAIRDPLAPVVTVEENYLAGADETPTGFPGMAHAQEHMAFRGCSGLAADQIAAIYAELGGLSNADTQQEITQYFATVPAADLEVALRTDAACMGGIQDSQQQWAEERGAIEQEVARDLSNPVYKYITRLNQRVFSGTPYAEDALGTQSSFDATTGAMLKRFADNWYAPNNAVLVIAGGIDPAAAITKVKEIYGHIPSHALPPHPAVHLQPVQAESFTIQSDLPYQLVAIAYRLPGTDSPDFAAVRILSDALSSHRGKLYDLVVQGKALETDFTLGETYRKASVGIAIAALPAGADPAPVIADVKKTIADAVQNGVPADLFAAARHSEIAGAEFERNSISGLAARWSDAVAARGQSSPEEELNAVRRATLPDVKLVASTYLLDQCAIVAVLKPVPSGEAIAAKGFGGSEKLTTPPSQPVVLPAWAETSLKSLAVPQPDLHPSDMTLANGIRLIVLPEKISPTVTVFGEVRHEAKLETPPGKEGIADVLENLFSYGTTTLDRTAFQKALDDMAAGESAGASFSLRVLKQYFSRGLQLLADNELHPALPEQAFKIVKQQNSGLVTGELKSPSYRVQRALEHALLPPHDPVLRQTTPATLSDVSLDDVKSYYAKTFRPDLTTIVIVGDITPQAAKREIDRWFGGWKPVGPLPDVVLPPVPPNQASSVYVPDNTQVQDSVALAEELKLNRFDPDYYALQVGDHVLGGGFYATRLYHDLRQVTGYVYTVEDSMATTKTRTLYTVTYASAPQNVSKAAALVKRDLSDMQSENVSPGELRQAKALLLRQIPLSESNENAIAGGLLGRAQLGLPLDEPLLAAQHYIAMSADTVRAAFAKWIRVDDFAQVVRGPEPQ